MTMTSIVPELFAAFDDHDLIVRPEPGDVSPSDVDAQFARAWRRDGTALRTGAGLALAEIAMLEHVLADVRGHCLIIGNGFGWSAVALGLILRGRGRVVALDACLEGDDGAIGIEVSNAIARERGLPMAVVRGTSPADIPAIATGHLDGRLDIVLIDGLHTDEQQAVDYEAVRPFCHPGTLVLFHDVLNWRMTASFASIAARDARASVLLSRTPSGMGALCAVDAPCLQTLRTYEGPVSPPSAPSSLWGHRFLDVSGAYLAAGDERLSRVYFDRALTISSAPDEAWLLRARQALTTGQWVTCLEAVAMARAAGGAPATLAHIEALVARATGASPDAVWATLSPHLDDADVSAEMLVDAASAAIGMGAFASASALADRAIALRPAWSLPWYLRGIAARAEGAGAEAVAEWFAAALTGEGVTAAIEIDAACAFLTAGDAGRAAEMAERVTRSQPDWSLSWHIRGLAARALGAPLEECHAWLAAALARPPVSAELATDAGFVALELDRLEEAARLAAIATDARPDWSLPWHLLALTARRRGEGPTGEAPFLRRALAGSPPSAELWHDAALLALASDDWGEAEACALRASDLRPDWDGARALLARVRQHRATRVAARREFCPTPGRILAVFAVATRPPSA